MNLETLIPLCLTRDRSAQKQLYDRYKDNLYTIAYRLTDDTALASDVLQETFIEAFRSLANLREHNYFHSWIRQILVRKAYRLLKKENNNESIDKISELRYRHSSDIEYIEKAIHMLPVKSRTVFVMMEIEGFSHKEISQALDISVGTSKSQLNYAKTKLKEILKSYMV